MTTIDSTLWNAIGSGAGGFLGVIVFFGIRLFIEWYRTRPELIATYLVANDINIDSDRQSPGEILHHKGKRNGDESTLRKFGFKYPVWEWSRDRVTNGGASVFFGPYTTDLTEPGDYEIRFYIRGVGFSSAAEIKQNYVLLEIDANEVTERTELVNVGAQVPIHDLRTFPEMRVASKKYIRVNDLVSHTNKPFVLSLTSDGYGLWEYRCIPFDGEGNRFDNLTRFEQTTQIFFEKVEVWRKNRFNIPWA